MQFGWLGRVPRLSLPLLFGVGGAVSLGGCSSDDFLAAPSSGGSGGTTFTPTGGGGQGTAGGGGGGSPTTCEPGATTHLAPQRVVLLSELEQLNAIRDLLGAEAVPADDSLPTDRGRTLDLDLVNQVSSKSLDAYDRLLTEVGKGVKTRAATVAACAAGTAPDACAKQFASQLAERAFRRAVTEEELTDLMAAYRAGAAISHEDGIATLTQAILFSPSLMYRRELGSAPTGQVAKLTSWEMADQLSHFLYNSIPDPGLVDAAKADTLTTDAGIREQLDRLLATERVRKTLSQTMMAWLQASKLAQVTKDAKYPDFGALQASMFMETSLFIDDMLWGQPRGVDELLTSTRSFVDPGLAKFYGVTYPGASGETGFLPVELPKDQRAGVLTQASFLSIKAGPDNTSVIFRGLFLRDKVLCLPEIAAPQDPGTLSKIAEQQMGSQTEVQKAQYRKETSPCNGCHAQFDPFGLALERYDGIGRYRTADETGTPIDASVDLSTFQSQGLSGSAAGIVDLAAQLHQRGQFATCLTSQIMTYAANQVLHDDDCGVLAVGRSLSPGNDKLTDMVRAIALSPTFRTRSSNGAM